MSPREPTSSERRLLKELVRRASNLTIEWDWDENLLVELMSDGGMGSLKLLPPNISPYRKFGGTVSNLEFDDSDGVKVSAVLNVDQDGQLFELDIWKTDFGRLVQIPEHF